MRADRDERTRAAIRALLRTGYSAEQLRRNVIALGELIEQLGQYRDFERPIVQRFAALVDEVIAEEEADEQSRPPGLRPDQPDR
jgi:hypothetical protein